MYAGHPLTRMFTVTVNRTEFFAQNRLELDTPVIGLLPGSRAGEWKRHLPLLLDTVERLQELAKFQFVLAVPSEGVPITLDDKCRKRISSLSIQLIEGDTWNLLAHSDLLLAASGTVTVEAALAGTPMVTYYKVAPISWSLGRRLVKVPHLTMVNLIAGREIVPEFMQEAATPQALADAAQDILQSPQRAARMRAELAQVRERLAGDDDPIARATDAIEALVKERMEMAQNHIG